MGTPPIIIKKVKKVVTGHHGGSWKVAYADFLAGMMTFFLLMWLITIMEPKQKAQIAAYFKKFNIFKKAGISMLMEYYKSGKITSSKLKTISQEIPPVKGKAEHFKRVVETYLKSLREHILINVEEEKKSIRLEIMELVNKPLFYSGSAELTPEAKKILWVIAKELRNMNVIIEVEGHTDAVPSRRGKLGNWELSTARALSTMLELEKNGIPPEKIVAVVGYADNFPLFKDNPLDPRNRRITLVIKFEQTPLSSQRAEIKAIH